MNNAEPGLVQAAASRCFAASAISAMHLCALSFSMTDCKLEVDETAMQVYSCKPVCPCMSCRYGHENSG